MKRKLMEVSLPLEARSKHAARAKLIRHGHPSTLHLWWRWFVAAARAVLFAQLVDDPSARLEELSADEDQRRERERLHEIIKRLVDWINVRDEQLLAEAHSEMLKSTNDRPPEILYLFAGGGTIPQEAQPSTFALSVVERARCEGRCEVDAGEPVAVPGKFREVIEEGIPHGVAPPGAENVSIVLVVSSENSKGFSVWDVRKFRKFGSIARCLVSKRVTSRTSNGNNLE